MFNTLVTNEDYLQYSGVDLQNELESIYGIGDNLAPRFIEGISEWCLDYLISIFEWDGQCRTEHQEKYFKRGVMLQIDWVMRNGNIANESGFNQATNTIIPRSELDKIAMSPSALMAFRRGGMANLKRF